MTHVAGGPDVVVTHLIADRGAAIRGCCKADAGPLVAASSPRLSRRPAAGKANHRATPAGS